MRFQPKPFLTLAFACSLLLAACETPASGIKSGLKAKQDPVSLQKKEETGAAPVVAPAPVSDAEKIAKLEQQVSALQQEVSAARPKIAKIDVMEQKFKDLSLGLDKIDATYNMKPMPAPIAVPVPVAPPVATSLPVPAPSKPTPIVADIAPPKAPEKPPEPPKPEVKAEAPKPAPVPVGEKIVKDLRIGEQKGFSRLVLDLGQSVKINYDIDNDEKILVVDIPGFAWKGSKTKTFEKSLLIASYQAESDEKGARLVVQLRQPAKVSNYSTIEATAGKLPRAVLDVAPQ